MDSRNLWLEKNDPNIVNELYKKARVKGRNSKEFLEFSSTVFDYWAKFYDTAVELDLRDKETRTQLAEADRRAGEAEIKLEQEAHNKTVRDAWMTRAKKQWGVDDNVSFDVVWAECLRLRTQSQAEKEELVRQCAEICDKSSSELGFDLPFDKGYQYACKKIKLRVLSLLPRSE